MQRNRLAMWEGDRSRWVGHAGALVLGAATVGVQAQVARPDLDTHCLIREIKAAPADTTAEQIRQRCEVLPASQLAQAKDHAVPIPQDKAAPIRSASAIETLLEKPESERSLLESRVASEVRAMGETFALLPHRPNYLLPLSYQDGANALRSANGANKHMETLFQISFKFPLTGPLFGGELFPFFAYTGRAWWQVYDANRSRPFREYNHEPEFFVAMPGSGFDFLGWKHRLNVVGLNHQSNGQSAPISRSWNRITAEVYADRGKEAWASLKLWHRFKESAKQSATDSNGDDNPDITRYLGNMELKLGSSSKTGHQWTLGMRHNLRQDAKGSLQLDWSHPSGYSPSLRWYAHAFYGYGDSLIDYNVKVQRLGVGVMLNDWF